LDTNVVLDWLVFDHPFMAPLRTNVQGNRTTVIAHELALEELRRVLAYPQLKLNSERQEEIANEYLAQVSMPVLPNGYARESLLLPQGFPMCRDRDDQPFLALAYHAKAHALVTRDKAILKLRKRALKFGVTIYDVPQAMTRLSEVQR
jgi:putative PIN family toxin of toxin-antitoxin system